MKLTQVPARTSLKGKRVFLRVDWNVPAGVLHGEDSIKIEHSIVTLKQLINRGAVVIVASHLGRPKGKDPALSLKRLTRLVSAHSGIDMAFVPEMLDTPKGLAAARERIANAEAGSVFVLENVRFYAGEEKNAMPLSKAFASLADIFMNDAFAACHRAHASVVGVAKLLPHFAGPSLVTEVQALQYLLQKPKHPFVAIIGGAKISTKIDLIQSVLTFADHVCIGGAMANTLLAAQGKQVGKSMVEKEGLAMAKKLLKEKKIVLPVDVVVAPSIANGVKVRATSTDEVKKTETIGDIGPETMRQWAELIKKAKTIMWNGPVGVTEIPSFSHGSLVIARAMAVRSKGTAFGVAGGGDTLPVIFSSGMSEWFDHLSTGGGAMLEFVAKKGKLPGILALESK
ncbi:phosphoglycerate kinase [Patescibacteria group bacterium]|nr:phosphoglycerate kinase [Patescibacteria group bacterium]